MPAAIPTIGALTDGLPAPLITALASLRDDARALTAPYSAKVPVLDDRGRQTTRTQTFLPQLGLSLVFVDRDDVLVTLSVRKPKDRVATARFAGEIVEPLKARIDALGLSWEAYMEALCLGG